MLAFVLYLGYQFLTFAGTLELTVTDPASDLAAYAGTSYVLRGETVPDAQITVDGLRENPTATASASGAFSIRVELLPGSNVITLVATDPLTGQSSPVRRTITVSLDTATPLPGGAPNLSSPEADAVISGGVTVAGRSRPSLGHGPGRLIAPTPASRSSTSPASRWPFHRGAQPRPSRYRSVPTLPGRSACRYRWGSAPGSSASARRPSHPPRRQAPPRRSRPSAA